MPDTGAPRWLRIARDDGTGLAIIGILSALRGISYLPIVVDPSRTPAHTLEGLLPVTWWAWVWIGIGLLCIAAIPWRRLIPPAVGLAVGIHTLWALSFISSWILTDASRAWVSALGYIGIALLFLWAFSRGKRSEVTLYFRDGTDT